MKKYLVLLMVHFISFSSDAQDKRGHVWICGGGGNTVTFSDTSKPTTGQLFPSLGQHFFAKATSNISDSATGKLLLLCNGARLWDTLGNLIENGDSLIPPKQFGMNNPPSGNATQCSLILPKGSSGHYYVFITGVTDSMFDKWFLPNATSTNADLLQYHVVDMNANGGVGKVVQKNIPLITDTDLSRVGMMACRHANGYDWWLLKQAFDTNLVYTFLVTKDTVELKFIQGFAQPKYGNHEAFGQSCFSTDGSKYAFSTGGVNTNINKLFLADFDRCTGKLENPKVFATPIDSTGYWYTDSIGQKDSVTRGLCFSPNDSFLYVIKGWNIYQFEYENPDSLQAWYPVHRFDTMAEYLLFGQVQRGIDGRIYIGKFGGNQKFNNVIDKPNIKGAGCQFCQFCLDFSTFNGVSTSPSNMPDFNLGAKAPCWPLESEELIVKSEKLGVYPNPASGKFFINTENKAVRELYNSVGQLLYSTFKNEIDISKLSSGIYYLKCGIFTKKVVIE